MMEDNDWLKGLQSKMKDYEEPAPEGLWENVESSVFPEKKRDSVADPLAKRWCGCCRGSGRVRRTPFF